MTDASAPDHPLENTPFDRALRRLRRDRAARLATEPHPLLVRMADEIEERLAMVSRRFERAHDLGAGPGLLGGKHAMPPQGHAARAPVPIGYWTRYEREPLGFIRMPKPGRRSSQRKTSPAPGFRLSTRRFVILDMCRSQPALLARPVVGEAGGKLGEP